MKRIIGVLTATRAEFGLLKPLIKRLGEEEMFEVKVLVTGMHLSPAFGNTYKEIEEAGIPIDVKVECITEDDTPLGMTENMAAAMTGFGKYFASCRPDLLIVLGDRYETLAVCIAAMNAGIPIAHIHGGELTEGAIDDAIRHSITKMSRLHFVSTGIYRKRVIQMGEQPDAVYDVGALAVENTRNTDFVALKDLGDEIGMDLSGDYAVVTFHPVTLEENSGMDGIDRLMQAMDEFPDMKFVITKANADAGGRYINARIDEYAAGRANVAAVTSLGARRYLSAVRSACFVLGNSSSGIIEAPCLGVPTVNIGDRQKGRLMPESVICCTTEKDAIVGAIKKAMSDDLREKIKNMDNPFGDGDTSEKITEVLRETFEKSPDLGVSKKFYDISQNLK